MPGPKRGGRAKKNKMNRGKPKGTPKGKGGY